MDLDPNTQNNHPNNDLDNTFQQKPKRNWKKIIGISAAVLVAVVAVAVFVITQSKDETPVQTAPVKQDIAILKVGTLDGPLNVFYPEGPTGSGTLSLNRQLFEGLVRFDSAQAKMVPLLATSWTNPDDQTWLFELKHDVKFHSGRTMTAQDVKDSFLSKNNGYYQAYGSTIKKIEPQDDYKLKITTNGPDPLLLNRLALLFVRDTKAKVASGTGPYQLKTDFKPTENQVELTAFDQYHGGHVYTRELWYKFVPGGDAAMAKAVRKGDLNVGFFIDSAEADKLDGQSYYVDHPDTNAIEFLAFNHHFTGPTQNVKVRQAIYHALNVPKILEAKKSTGVLANQIVPQNIPGYNPEIQRLNYDPARAKSLLKEAGYPQGITLKLASFDEPKAQMDELIKQLAAVGIKVQHSPESGQDIEKVVFDPTTQAFVLSYGTDLQDLSDVVGAVFSDDLYGKADVNKLLKQADQTIDASKRLQILQQISKTIMDDVGWVPLWVLEIGRVTDKPYNFEAGNSAIDIYYWQAHL